MAYKDSGFKNSLPPDRLATEMKDVYKKQIHLNGWPRERPEKERSPKKQPSQTTIDP